MTSNWFRRLLGIGSKKSSARKRHQTRSGRARVRPFLEPLEDRIAPATNITVIGGAAGTGSLDQFLSATDGTIAVTDAPGDVAATLSVGALQGVGSGVAISITADSNITFNNIGTLNLLTGLGVNAGFTTNSGVINFVQPLNTVVTGGGSLTLSAGPNLPVGTPNTTAAHVTPP